MHRAAHGRLTGGRADEPGGLNRGNAAVCADVPSTHDRVRVLQNARFRWLEFDNGVVQSAMDRRAPARLVLPYCWWLLAAAPVAVLPRRIAVLGLGGGSLVRFAWHVGLTDITAVEHEPAVVEVARRWFGCAARPLELRVEDARVFLADAARRFDLLVCDLFTDTGMPPWIGQPAFYDLARRALADGGWLTVNLAPLDATELDTVLAAMRAAFEGRVLRATVPDTGNDVAFAFAAPPMAPQRITARHRAAVLQRRTGLPFANMLNALFAANPTRGNRLVF